MRSPVADSRLGVDTTPPTTLQRVKPANNPPVGWAVVGYQEPSGRSMATRDFDASAL
jgi:hypothetical protein